MPRRRAQSPAAALNALSAVWWRITRLARLAVVLLVSGLIIGPALALSGQKEFGAAAALTPFVGAILWLAAFRKPQNIVAITPLVGLAAVPRNRREIFRTAARWMARYLAAVAAVSAYLYLVPVSRNPWLVLPLIATVLLLLFLYAGRALGGTTKFLLFSLIAGITIAFFFSGKEEAAAAAQAGAGVSQAQVAGATGVEEFTINTGEEVDTVETGPGTKHLVSAEQDWVLISALADGTPKEYPMRAGQRSLIGGNIAGPARVKALADNTQLRFKKVL